MSVLDMTAYNGEDGPSQCALYWQPISEIGDDTFNAEAEGWQVTKPHVQKSVSLDGLSFYDATDIAAKNKKDKSQSKSQTKGKGKAKKPDVSKNSSDYNDDDANGDWEIIPQDPDWDVVPQMELYKAQNAGKPEPPLDEDWVACAINQNGEIEMFEGVRAHKEETYATLTPKKDKDEQDKNLQTCLSPTIKPPSKRSYERLHPGKKGKEHLPPRQDRRSCVPLPTLSRISTSRTQKTQPKPTAPNFTL